MNSFKALKLTTTLFINDLALADGRKVTSSARDPALPLPVVSATSRMQRSHHISNHINRLVVDIIKYYATRCTLVSR